MLKSIAAATLIAAWAGAASASCVGTQTFATCYDGTSGNSYTIQRYGNTTQMQGTNARTGSNWSQETYDHGDTTFQYGRDSRGRNWSTTCVNGQCF
jgi:hypothetical protein